jgi:hypothetical protein
MRKAIVASSIALAFTVAGCAGHPGALTGVAKPHQSSNTSHPHLAILRIADYPLGRGAPVRVVGNRAKEVSPNQIAFETSGSSDCPMEPSSVKSTVRGLTFDIKVARGPCLANLVFSTLVVTLSQPVLGSNLAEIDISRPGVPTRRLHLPHA